MVQNAVEQRVVSLEEWRETTIPVIHKHFDERHAVAESKIEEHERLIRQMALDRAELNGSLRIIKWMLGTLTVATITTCVRIWIEWHAK